MGSPPVWPSAPPGSQWRHRRRFAAMALPLAAAAFLPAAPATAAPAGGAPSSGSRRLVVRLDHGAAAADVAHGAGGRVARQVEPGTVAVAFPRDAATRALRRLEADPRVASVEPDVVYRAAGAPRAAVTPEGAAEIGPAAVEPNDPCLTACFGVQEPSQWGVRAVGGPEAWSLTQGRPDILVAVLDGGVDVSHPDLVGKVVVGPKLSASPTTDDLTGHGTGVAGTIAAIPDNGEGIAGLGWSTRVLSVKVLDDRGEGFGSDVAAGVRAAVASGASVVNLSLVGGRSFVVRDAIADAQRAGVLVVAAAGNDGSGAPEYPAAYPRVLGVAATGRDDGLAPFSNRGRSVLLGAPGVGILSTAAACGGCRYALQTGTSSAAPHVAAAAALLLATSPAPNADEVRVRLSRSAVPIPDAGAGILFGRIDVPAALRATAQGHRLAASDGGVFSFGESAFAGSAGGGPLNRPVVAAASTPTNRGYWLAASDGGIFSFGDAPFAGSVADRRLNRPIVGIRPTPKGLGYWLVASDGGIFAFGDARFLGSAGALTLRRPIVGMAPTPTGEGYWLVASDGGIFAFGDARFLGSTGATPLRRPIVGMATTPSGEGYWLVASDGGIFAFGDARFLGSTGAVVLNQPVVGMLPTPSGRGYWLAASDGGIFGFGDARFTGSAAGAPLNRPVVAIAG